MYVYGMSLDEIMCLTVAQYLLYTVEASQLYRQQMEAAAGHSI